MKASYIKIIFDSGFPFHFDIIDLPLFDHPWHFHPEIELTMILESSGLRYVGDHVSQFKEGDLVLLGSGLPHLWQNEKIHINDNRKRSKAIVLQFPQNLISGIPHDSLELKPLNNLFRLAQRGISFPEKIGNQAASMLPEILNKNGLRKWAAILDLISILIESEDYELLASLGYRSNLTSRDCAIMDRLLDYVRNNFEKKISLQDMADMANLSKQSFCRYFKKNTSKSFFTFLNEYRIGHAKKILQEDIELPVGDIAFQSGFPNIQHFNTKFKEFNGITPSQFRNRHGHETGNSKIVSTFDLN